MQAPEIELTYARLFERGYSSICDYVAPSLCHALCGRLMRSLTSPSFTVM
jgi:hypothetical protein